MEFRASHGCHGDHKLFNTCQIISLDVCNSLALKEICLNLMQNFSCLGVPFRDLKAQFFQVFLRGYLIWRGKKEVGGGGGGGI